MQDAQVVWPTFSSCTYDEEWLKRAIEITHVAGGPPPPWAAKQKRWIASHRIADFPPAENDVKALQANLNSAGNFGSWVYGASWLAGKLTARPPWKIVGLYCQSTTGCLGFDSINAAEQDSGYDAGIP